MNEELKIKLMETIENAMSSIDYSMLKKIDQRDINRFNISSENEEYICSLIEDSNVVSVRKFYFILNGKDYNTQSVYEKSNFGAKYGDIVFCDGKNFKDAIDIKIGETMFGAVSVHSIKCFEGSTYLCINKAEKSFIVLSAKKLYNALSDDNFVATYVYDNKFIKVQKLVNDGAVVNYLV